MDVGDLFSSVATFRQHARPLIGTGQRQLECDIIDNYETVICAAWRDGCPAGIAALLQYDGIVRVVAVRQDHTCPGQDTAALPSNATATTTGAEASVAPAAATTIAVPFHVGQVFDNYDRLNDAMKDWYGKAFPGHGLIWRAGDTPSMKHATPVWTCNKEKAPSSCRFRVRAVQRDQGLQITALVPEHNEKCKASIAVGLQVAIGDNQNLTASTRQQGEAIPDGAEEPQSDSQSESEASETQDESTSSSASWSPDSLTNLRQSKRRSVTRNTRAAGTGIVFESTHNPVAFTSKAKTKESSEDTNNSLAVMGFPPRVIAKLALLGVYSVQDLRQKGVKTTDLPGVMARLSDLRKKQIIAERNAPADAIECYCMDRRMSELK